MAGQHILIIEDNPDIAGLLSMDLQDEGYVVRAESTAVTGMIYAREAKPDLVLLDLGLPDMDGRQVVSRLRKTSTVPILILTARGSVDEKVELFTLGADDYVVKPYALAELLARVEVQLRHRQAATLKLGALELSPPARLATYQGMDLRVTAKEFELLLVLMQGAGRVVRREELLAKVWQNDLPDDTNTLDVHMGNLRKKLQAAGGTRVLRTVRGYGYSLLPQG